VRDHALQLPTHMALLQVAFRAEAAAGVAVIHSERVGGATEAVGVAAFNFLFSCCSARFCACKRALLHFAFAWHGIDPARSALRLRQTVPAAAKSWELDVTGANRGRSRGGRGEEAEDTAP
jgi:hypothetical protein